MSETIVQLLADVMADVTEVGKGDKNDFHKFMYRGVDRIINAVGPALRRHRVVVLPHLDSLESRDTSTDKGKTAREVTVIVTYTFRGPAGDEVSCTVPGESQDTGDKAVSKAMSVAYRTALIQALTIPTEQRDPDSHTYTREASAVDGWKKKIWAFAQEKGWDIDVLGQSYEEFSGGLDIQDATAEELKKYHEHLVPPRTVRRAAS